MLTEERWKIGFLVATAALMAFLSFDPKLDIWGDNALFIILARSIASGQGMRDISSPGAPSSSYAFGFPAMLAIIEWLSPGNHLAEKLLVVGWFLLAIPLLYLLARDVVGPAPAFWAAAITASNSMMMFWSNQVMTEMPFLSISLLALLLLGRAMAKADRPSDPLFVGSLVAILAAMTIRSVGLVLALAVPLTAIIRRRRRLLAVILSFLIAAIAAAIVAGYAPALWGYVRRLLGALPEDQGIEEVLQSLMWRAKTNIWFQFVIDIPIMILPFPGAWLPVRLLIGLRALVALIVLPLLAVGLGRMLRRSEPWAVYTGLYLLAIVIWEPELAIIRALIPVLPFLILSIVVGAMPVLSWCRERWPKSSPWLQSGLVCLVFAVNLWANIDFTRMFRDYPPQWQGYFDAASWIGQHTSRESIIAARKPYLLYLTSKRQSIMPPYSPSPEQFLEGLRSSRATHVVVDQLGFPQTPQLLVPVIRRYPEIFRPAYATATRPPTLVFRVDWSDTAASTR